MDNKFLIISDCDNTLINGNSWHITAEYLNKAEEERNIRERYENLPKTEENVDEWTKEIARIFSGMEYASLEGILGPESFVPGAEDFFKSLNHQKVHTGIVSAGVNLIIDQVRDYLNTGFAISNILYTNEGVLTGEVEKHVNYQNKGGYVQIMQSVKNIPMERTIFLGDNEADISAFRASKYRLAIDSSNAENLKEEVGNLVVVKDFHEVKRYLQREDLNIFNQ